jgi:SpoVK/Ycf46/Vps4 family AAA+-type ATPase
VSALAPELLSRFDDIFFVDLPSAAERAEIIGVHLKKRGQTPEDYDLTAVAQATWGFAGREIERVVSFAIEAAYCDGQPLTTDLMIAAAGGMKPISVTMAAQIDAIRAWVTTSDALLANEGLEPKPETAQGHRRLDVE